MSAAAKEFHVKRPDLAREGASLQKSVQAELEWVRRLVKASASKGGEAGTATGQTVTATKRGSKPLSRGGPKLVSKRTVKKK